MDKESSYCPYCNIRRSNGNFYHVRGLGILCESCLLDRTGYANIEEWQREQFRRGNPRRG
jgi:hypothetical protein